MQSEGTYNNEIHGSFYMGSYHFKPGSKDVSTEGNASLLIMQCCVLKYVQYGLSLNGALHDCWCSTGTI